MLFPEVSIKTLLMCTSSFIKELTQYRESWKAQPDFLLIFLLALERQLFPTHTQKKTQHPKLMGNSSVAHQKNPKHMETLGECMTTTPQGLNWQGNAHRRTSMTRWDTEDLTWILCMVRSPLQMEPNQTLCSRKKTVFPHQRSWSYLPVTRAPSAISFILLTDHNP